MKEYLEENEWAKTAFDKHIATKVDLPLGDNDCYIKFKDPETSNGAMEFIYIGGYLTIQGDYGNSSYTWYNSKNTIQHMAGFAKSIGYFFSKHQSFEGDMQEWCQDTCISTVKEWIEDYEIELDDETEAWESHTETQCEWVAFMYRNGQERFKDDEYDLFGAGLKVKNKAYLQVLGFIKAVDFLEREKRQ